MNGLRNTGDESASKGVLAAEGNCISDGDIINGSTDIASTSVWLGLGLDGLDGPLADSFRELASETFIALLSRRMMNQVAIKTARRRAIAPPIIPPSWTFVRPDEVVDVLS